MSQTVRQTYPETSHDKKDATEVKNFTRVPNMLIYGYHDTVSPQEKWLYMCLKHFCGKKGTRHLSLRYISELTGISTGALSKSKNSEGMIKHLHDAGLIHAEIKKPQKGNPQFHITITDVWLLNQNFFDKTCPNSEQVEDEDTEPVRNSDEPVHISDRSVQNSDEPVRNSANTNIRDKTINKITEQDIFEETQTLNPIPFPKPEQPKRKPSKPKVDPTLQTRIDQVYDTFDSLYQEVLNDKDAHYSRNQKTTEAIKEFLQCSPTSEKLRMVYLDLWSLPPDKSGFYWRQNMSIAAVCRNYDRQLLAMQGRKQQSKPVESKYQTIRKTS